MSIEEGVVAPDFTLPSSSGENVTLSDFRGGPIVLWFYPKDKTPGCTKEACAFTELSDEFTKLGVTTFGISKDSMKSHHSFIEKYGLKSALLSDEDHSVQDVYGVWAEKKNYGKVYWGTVRTTVLIDSDGVIAKLWTKVRVKDHVASVLEAAKAL